MNQKGYMLVEIVIASVIAMSIGYYLLNLTYKFKNTYLDIYQSYYYTSDKILITKNIMNDLENNSISLVIANPKSLDFNLYKSSNNAYEKRRLVISEEENTTIIKYGKINNLGEFNINDVSYYEKILEPSLIVGDIELLNNNSITIVIPIKSIYGNTDYSIKLHVNTYNPR